LKGEAVNVTEVPAHIVVEGFAAIVTVVTKVLFTVNIVALTISAPEEGVIVIVPVVAPAGNVVVI
jgi:hypothetical protein